VVCLFGFFPTLAWEDILEYAPAVDCVVVGEPEEALGEGSPWPSRPGKCPRAAVLLQGAGQGNPFRDAGPHRAAGPAPFPLRPSLEAEETVSVLASRGLLQWVLFLPHSDPGRRQAVWRGRTVRECGQ